MQSTLGNNLGLFSNEQLNVCSNNLETCNPQAYDNIKNLYLNGALSDPKSPYHSFVEMVYKERVYPTPTNAYQKINRERIGYENDFWHNSRTARTTLGAKKWGGS